MDEYSVQGFRKPDEQTESHTLNGTNVEPHYTYRNSSQFDMMPRFFGTSPVGGGPSHTAAHALYPPSSSHFNTSFGASNLDLNPSKFDAFPQPFAAAHNLWGVNMNDPVQLEPPASSCNKHGRSLGCYQEAQKKSAESEFRCRWQGCVYNGTFAKEATLMRHIKSTHVSPELYKCPGKVCKKSFGRKDKFKTHIRLVHPELWAENPKQCGHCHEEDLLKG